MSLCIDCTECITYRSGYYCGVNKVLSPVDGKPHKDTLILCGAARSELNGECGPEGKLWEAYTGPPRED